MKIYPTTRFKVGDVFKWVNGKNYRVLDIDYDNQKYIYNGHLGTSTADIAKVDIKAREMP